MELAWTFRYVSTIPMPADLPLDFHGIRLGFLWSSPGMSMDSPKKVHIISIEDPKNYMYMDMCMGM